MDEELLKPADIASRLRVSCKTLTYWRAINTGPPSVKIGGSIRYPRSEYENWWAATRASTLRGEAA